MKKLTIVVLAGILIISSNIYPQKHSGNNAYNPSGEPNRSYLNLNNISTQIYNNGISDIDPYGNSAFTFPKEIRKTAIFTSGLLWGAMIPGDPFPRVGGSAYRSGLQGGKILSSGFAEDSSLPHVRIYRVRADVYPGGPPVDLSWEAFDEGKTQVEVRAQYELDWVEWRAIDGAPYDDVDANGSYDPNIDIPGFPGANQTVWFVANDMDPARTNFLYGAQPMGIEVQATFWAYQQIGASGNTYFRKYKLMNKGFQQNTIENMYISMWSDPDIGDSGDDYVGCDTTLNLGYAYNAHDYDAEYDPYPPPAVGFDFLQGPSIPGGDTLPMTAFYYFTNGDPNIGDPPQGNIQGSVEFYNFMQGLVGTTGAPFIDPTTGLETTFLLNGDPLSRVGWIDGMLLPPGDRRMGLASGPFNMAVGDTQEVVIAEIAAIGFDRLNALMLLKFYDILVQDAFDNGLEINTISPPKPPTPIVTADDADWVIELDWGTDSASVEAIENFNQGGYAFQGYNLYQFSNPLPVKENAVRVATFDIIDGVTEIEGIVMDPETGLPIMG
ncbi:MAG: hypothetical protein KJO12_03875, partial [Ignavibacteria bacterium]|nr:hypothetical protein [Ignavibacteria bacterium]